MNATDVIYAAGTQSNDAAAAGPVPGCNACNAPATIPGGIALTSSANYVTFSSVMGSLTSSDGNVCASPEGCVVMNNNGGNAVNDPDGNGAGAPGISASSGEGSISGVVAPGWGYLVGRICRRRRAVRSGSARAQFYGGRGERVHPGQREARPSPRFPRYSTRRSSSATA